MLSIGILFCILLISFLAYRITRKKFFITLVLVSLNLFILEALLYGYFLLLIVKGDSFFLIGNQKVLDALNKLRITYATYFVQERPNFIYQLDNDLGYTVGKNKNTGTYRTNADGMRSDREYALVPPGDTLRMAAFGDSFVFCDAEKNKDTWPVILEQMAGNLEVLNFGVSGYGLGQSYLRYLKDGVRFHPDIVFVNYSLLGDRDRIDYRQMATTNNIRMSHFYRARFALKEGKLVTQNTSPYHFFDPQFREQYVFQFLPEEYRKPIWSSPLLTSTNLGLFVKIFVFKKSLASVDTSMKIDQAQNAQLSYVVLKNLITTAKHQGSQLIIYNSRQFTDLPIMIQKLIQEYRSVVHYVWSDPVFNRQKELAGNVGKIHNHTRHYNQKGNTLYAKAILSILQENVWGSGPRTFKYNFNNNRFELVD